MYQYFGNPVPVMDAKERARIIGANVKRLREASGDSQIDLAKKIGVSSANTVGAIELGITLKSRHLPDIARVYRVPLTDVNPFVDLNTTESVIPPEARVLQVQEFLTNKDMPLYSSVEAGEGAIVISSDPIGTTPRPVRLDKVGSAYGIVVVGRSMAPILRPGTIVHIHPGLKPRPEDLCVFIKESDGEFVATIKEYISQTTDIWIVKRYKPKEQEFPLKKSEWRRCEVVVGTYYNR